MAASLYLIICSKCQNDVGVSDKEVSPTFLCSSCGSAGLTPSRSWTPAPKPLPAPSVKKPKKRKAPRAATSLLSSRTERQAKSGAFAIYAIQMKAGVVKVGRTSNWAVRKHSYTHGFDDAIKRCAIFWVLDDFEILADIETALLQSIWHPRAKGYEWISADFDEIAEHTDQFLRTNGIMFDRE